MTASRRCAVALGLAALLGACGDTPAAQALRRAPQPAPPAVTAEGPALYLSTPRRAVLLPMSGGGVRRLWRGEGGIALATDGARVVGSAGLRQMLMATRFDDPDPLADPRALVGHEAVARRSLDLAGDDRDPATMRFGLVLECRLRGREEAGWIVVEERCTGAIPAFTNRFWAVPETGLVLHSEQWAGDEVGLLTLEMRGGAPTAE